MNKLFAKLSLLFLLIIGALLHSTSFANEELIRADIRKKQSAGLRSEILSFGAKTALGASAAFCVTYCLPESLTAMAGGLGSPAIGALGICYWCKDRVIDAVSAYGLMEPTENIQRATKLNELEEKFEIFKARMGNYNSNELARSIAESRRSVGYGLKTVHEWDKKRVEHQLAKIDTILKLPLKPAKSLDDIELKEALDILEKHLETYSDMVHDAIIKAAIKINNLAKSYEGIIVNKESLDAAKASFWFVGEAGVGKTETAEILAKSLKRPFCKLNLANTSIDDLFGRIANGFDSYEKTGELGAFARCYIAPDWGSPALNPIIFIDEVHDVLNGEDKLARKVYSLMKIITEGKEKEIHENSLGAKLDISETVFIFGSNVLAKKDKAGALASRVKTIIFDNLTFAQKEVIGTRNFERLCFVNAYEPQQNDDKNLSVIYNKDKSPGARVLINVVDEFIITQQALGLGRLRCKDFDAESAIKANGGKI